MPALGVLPPRSECEHGGAAAADEKSCTMTWYTPSSSTAAPMRSRLAGAIALRTRPRELRKREC